MKDRGDGSLERASVTREGEISRGSRSKRSGLLRIITRLNVGGPSIHVSILTRAFSGGLFDTTLVAGSLPEGEAEMTREIEGLQERIVRIPSLVKPIRPLSDLCALIALYRLMRRSRPLVVHTHHAKAGALGRIAAFLSGVPIRVHTYHADIFRGHFGAVKSRIWLFLEKILARFATDLVVISEVQLENFLRDKIAPREKFRLIRLGFDLSRHLSTSRPTGLRASIGIPEDAPLIAYMGRFSYVKDLELLVEAFSVLSSRRPDSYLLLAGGGETEGKIRSLVKSMGLAERVVFPGWIEKPWEALADADIAVLTSRNEGTPVALIEAQACGVPVVATPAGGVPEAMRDGITGILAPPEAPALAKAMDDLLSDPDRMARMGEEGRAFVSSRFDKERLIREIEALYEEKIR